MQNRESITGTGHLGIRVSLDVFDEFAASLLIEELHTAVKTLQEVGESSDPCVNSTLQNISNVMNRASAFLSNFTTYSGLSDILK